MTQQQKSTRTAKLIEDLLLPQLSTAILEWLSNNAVSLNANKQVSFSSLHQKTLTIELAELPFPISLSVNVVENIPDMIVTAQHENSDCIITTSLKTLNKIRANESLTQLIKQNELDVHGDIKVAQHFAQIAQALDIDWQSELAKHIGDGPTYKLVNLGQQVSHSLRAKVKQFDADVSEFVVHEKRLIVTNSQLRYFNQQVEEVAQATGALAERVDKLIALNSDEKSS